MYNNSIVMKKDVKMNVSVKFDSVSGKFVGSTSGKDPSRREIRARW